MASSPGHIVAPILGAAGGTVVVTIAVEKLKIRRPVAAFGTAAVSLMAARNSTGAARVAFEAAGIAAVCIGVTELLARLRKPKAEPAAPVRQSSTPPDAVTSAELRNALATIRAKHEADVAEREQAHRATIHSLLAQLRDAQPRRPERLRIVEAAPPHDAVAAAERIAAIYPLLNEGERRRWSTLVATMPKAELTRIERELLRGTPDDGVAYLRATVLSPRHLPS